MIDTLSRGIDAIAGRLRQMAAGYDRTILFTTGSLDAGCDSAPGAATFMEKVFAGPFQE
ncbi:hypothetical protein ACWWU7_18395 [Stenotrophomonas sp. SM006]